MKKTRFWLFMMAIISSVAAMAQDKIKVEKFEQDLFIADAAATPKKDINGRDCAVIRITTNDPSLKVEPNMLVDEERNGNEILLWVTEDCKYLDITADNAMALTYEIKGKLKGKVTYDMAIVVVRGVSYPFFFNAGFNVMSIMGPSLSFGYHFGNFNVEAGVVLGLNKSDDLFFYEDNNTTLRSAHNYKAIRMQLRGGYDVTIPNADFLTIEPQVGLAYNLINGSKLDVSPKDNSYMKSVSSVSALLAVRAKFAINNHWRLQITPEYDFGISKDDDLKSLSDFDKTIKSWTDGFNLNLGIMLYF